MMGLMGNEWQPHASFKQALGIKMPVPWAAGPQIHKLGPANPNIEYIIIVSTCAHTFPHFHQKYRESMVVPQPSPTKAGATGCAGSIQLAAPPTGGNRGEDAATAARGSREAGQDLFQPFPTG